MIYDHFYFSFNHVRRKKKVLVDAPTTFHSESNTVSPLENDFNNESTMEVEYLNCDDDDMGVREYFTESDSHTSYEFESGHSIFIESPEIQTPGGDELEDSKDFTKEADNDMSCNIQYLDNNNDLFEKLSMNLSSSSEYNANNLIINVDEDSYLETNPDEKYNLDENNGKQKVNKEKIFKA